jgi:hypothetical protein
MVRFGVSAVGCAALAVLLVAMIIVALARLIAVLKTLEQC